MNLALSDEETAALTGELANIAGNDGYPFLEHIRTLKAILAKLRPEPVRSPYRRRRCVLRREQRPQEDGAVGGSDASSFRAPSGVPKRRDQLRA